MSLALLFQLAASITAISSIWVMGNKSWKGPAIGLFSQVLWIGVILTAHLWGLVPLTLAMIITHTRNLYLWWPRNSNPVPEVF